MLPGDSPAATCSYGEGFLSQTLGKQLQPEPLSACPAFIRRKSIRKNKHSSSLCTHIPGPAVRGRPGAPRWCPKPGTAPSLALGLLGSKGGCAASAKGFSLFPSPARGHIPIRVVRHKTSPDGLLPPEGIPFQRGLEAAELSFDPPVPFAPSLPTASCTSPRQGERQGADRIPDPPSRQALAEPEPRINMLRL